jgi:hypothetical protein
MITSYKAIKQEIGRFKKQVSDTLIHELSTDSYINIHYFIDKIEEYVTLHYKMIPKADENGLWPCPFCGSSGVEAWDQCDNPESFRRKGLTPVMCGNPDCPNGSLYEKQYWNIRIYKDNEKIIQDERNNSDLLDTIGTYTDATIKSGVMCYQQTIQPSIPDQEDIKEIYAEAKAVGFDNKIMRKIVQLRKMETDKRREEEELLDLYKSAIGLL